MEKKSDEGESVVEQMLLKRNSIMVNNPSDLAAILQQKMDEDDGSDTSSKISDVPSHPS